MNEELKVIITAEIGKLKNSMDDAKESLEQFRDKTKKTSKEVEAVTAVANRQAKELTELKRKYVDIATSQGAHSDAARACAEEIERLSTEYKENRDKVTAAAKAANSFDKSLDKAEDAADDTADAVEDLSKETKTTATEGKKNFNTFAEASKSCGKAVATALKAAAAAIIAAGAALVALSASTQDYRIAQAKLETAFETAGASAVEAEQTYFDLYRVLGEDDTAVEAANHLAQLTTNQEELSEWTRICQGVYATFGDSLPIEGLTEAANETAKVGQVTGALADALNWAGVSEDAFNESLQACNTEAEREALIRETLTGLYEDAAAAYEENAAEILAANEAQAALTDGLAELGEVVQPLITLFKKGLAEALRELVPYFELISDGVNDIANDVEGGADKLAEGISGALTSIVDTIADALPTILSVGIEIVMALLEGVIEALPQVINTISALLPDLVTTIIEMIPHITAAVLDSLPVLLDAVIQVVLGILDGLGTALPEIVKQVAEIIPDIVQALIDAVPLLLDAAIVFLMAIVDAIPEIIPPLIAALPALIDSLIAALIESVPLLIEGAISLFMALIDAIPIILPALVEALPQIIDSIITGLLDLMPLLLEGAIELFMAFVFAIPEIIPALLSAWGELAASLLEVVGNLGDDIEDFLNEIKDIIAEKFEEAKENVTEIWNNIKTAITNRVDEIKTNVSTKFGNIKTSIQNALNAAKETVTNVWTAIDSATGGRLSTTYNKVKTVFTNIKTTITNLINGAKTAVNNAIEAIKDFFDFEWSLPELKMPSISITGKFSLSPLQVPKFSISWNEFGGVFDKPTLFSYGNSLQGLGENGAEAVVPLENNLTWLDKLADMLNDRMDTKLQVVLKVGEREFGECAIDSINAITKQTGSLPLKFA